MNQSWIDFVSPVLPTGWALPPQVPFHFRSADADLAWTPVSSNDEGETRVDVLAAPGGLRLNCRTTRFAAERAFVVQLDLVNTGAAPSVPFARIEPLRLVIQTAEQPVHGRVLGGGGNEKVYPPHAFRHDTLRFDAGGSLWTENGFDGRSSNRDLPFLTLRAGEGALVCALEWSAKWWGSLARQKDRELLAFIHIPIQGLTLAPGETLSLPAAHYVFSTAGGLDGAGHAFRRYLNRRVLPQAITPPASYDHWFGIGPDINEEILLTQADLAAELGLEYFVVDAGWYPGCLPGNFDAGVGNLALVDAEKFPRGLEPVAARVRARGLKIGLWFELERAHRGSRWAREHPEWFWDLGRPFLHLNLARREAQEACIALLTDAIRRLGLEWIKLDCNMGPRPYWESADPTGKVQFAYCAGLYRVLDATLRANPSLVMECCASGGRRIDLGILRRAHTAWISDECLSAENTRFMQCGAGHLLPNQLANSAIPFGRSEGAQTFTDYDVLSRMVGAFQICGDLRLLSSERRTRMRELVALYKRFRHLLPQEFHPLLPQPRDDRDWQAVQFTAEDRSAAVVLAFSGTAPSPDPLPALRLQGLDARQQYVCEPLHVPAASVVRDGGYLAASGLTVSLPPRSWCGWLLRRQ